MGVGEGMTIGALAAATGLTPRAIRFYEDSGLIAPQRRNGQRLYDQRDRARLALIQRGKRLGFSIAEIREFLGLYDLDRSKGEQMRFLAGKVRTRLLALEAQRADIERTMAELIAVDRQLADWLAAQPPEDEADPPICSDRMREASSALEREA